MKEKIITNLIFLILVNFVCDSGSWQQSEPKIVHVALPPLGILYS